MAMTTSPTPAGHFLRPRDEHTQGTFNADTACVLMIPPGTKGVLKGKHTTWVGGNETSHQTMESGDVEYNCFGVTGLRCMLCC